MDSEISDLETEINDENVCHNIIPPLRLSVSENMLSSTKGLRRRKFKPTGKIKKLRTSLVSKDHIIEALQQELSSKSVIIESLKNELQNLQKSNVNVEQQPPKHVNDRNMSGLKEDLQYLEQKMSDFSMKYDENTLLKLYENDPESLNIEQNIKSTEMSAKWLNNQLKNIKKFCNSVTRPHMNEYKEWNMNMTMTWIKSLDNGYFIKYAETLRRAFESDGIKAADLPYIGQADLATTPFEIRSFKDRKTLADHFKVLEQFDIESKND